MTATVPHEAAGRVPDAVAPPPGHPRFPLLDSLRAIAALAVVVDHAGFYTQAVQNPPFGALLANGAVGVTVFFVLSGFLLYRPFLAADLDGAPGIAIGAFARRRALRILPAYWLALTVLEIVPGLSGDVFGPDWWKYYGLMQVYWDTAVFGGLDIAWTLCVEITFYLALPFYALALRRAGSRLSRPGRVRLELIVLAVLGVASATARAIALGGDPSNLLLITLPGYFLWFAVGMAMAVLSVGPAPGAAVAFVRRHTGACWALAAGLYVVLAVVTGRSPATLQQLPQWRGLGFHLLGAAIAGLLVLPAVVGTRTDGLPGRVLAWRPLAWMGLISYGIYLWHDPLIETLNGRGVATWIPGLGLVTLIVCGLVLTLVCAAVSYYAVERPLMRRKNGRARRPPDGPARTGEAPSPPDPQAVAPAAGTVPAR